MPEATPDPSARPAPPPPEGVLREIDWKGAFPALLLFRAFRVAIHPSKLLLAIVFILLVYGIGRSMDLIWPAGSTYREVGYFLTQLPTRPGGEFTGPRSGPFDVFLKWQLTQLHELSKAVLSADLPGIVGSVYNFAFCGPGWGFSNHPIFSTIFGAVLLLGWSIFGGAISRVAAVHVARDEKISVRNALRFSSGKLLSFLFAPVILFLFIGGLGFAIALTNLLFYLPWGLGPAIVGAGFIVTLVAAFIMTLVLFGTVGGFGLMYPTIAVEGSDAFDAISRSFSYFFARPWKLLFYSLVALIYGVITYLFIKLFVYVMFGLIQTFQVWFLTESLRADYKLFFPPVSFESLSFSPDYKAMDTFGLKAGSAFLSFWYYLVVCVLGAYAISFYFSAQTIIYYLLRLDVDVTELDDVYLEEGDEEDIAEQTLPDADTHAKPAADTPAPDTHEDPPTVGPSSPVN